MVKQRRMTAKTRRGGFDASAIVPIAMPVAKYIGEKIAAQILNRVGNKIATKIGLGKRRPKRRIALCHK